VRSIGATRPAHPDALAAAVNPGPSREALLRINDDYDKLAAYAPQIDLATWALATTQ
jgi:hypothetical protein